VTFLYWYTNIGFYRPGPSHIVPVLVGDPALAKAASDKLLAEHDIYVQSINYPTVARGEERLRITVTPRHTLEQINKLVGSVDQIFTELGINRLQDWIRLGGRASVGVASSVAEVKPIWTDEQLGMRNGTTPKTLRKGEKAYLDPVAVEKARSDFQNLLGPISGPVQATRGVYPVVEADHEKSVVGSWKVKMGTGVLRKREALAASSAIAAAA